MAMDASSYASQAKSSADKAEMYSQTSEDRWSVFDKRLTNVENGISADPFVTDDTVAYQKTAPASALPYAALERLGGMTKLNRNLFNGETTNYAVRADGSLLSYQGSRLSDYIQIDGRTVTLSAKVLNPIESLHISAYDAEQNFIERVTSKVGGASITYSNANATYVRVGVYEQSCFDMNTFQLEYGTTATAYTPYPPGMHHAAVTAIESAGKNLFDNRGIDYTAGIRLNFQTYGEYIRINGTKVAGSNIVPVSKPNLVLPAGTYALSIRFISGTLTRADTTVTDDSIMFGINSSGYGQRTSGAVNKVGDVGTRIFTITEPTAVATFDITPGYSGTGNVYDNVVVACQLERADAVTDFEPYVKETFPIPTTLTSLPYYGYGISADVHNYIDFENIEYVQMCSVRAYQSGDENNPEVVTDGTTTVYALSAPMRTPITYKDNYIRVGGSGTLTFVNEHKLAVPSTVLYLTKEATV
jgi:hypothetical protein